MVQRSLVLKRGLTTTTGRPSSYIASAYDARNAYSLRQEDKNGSTRCLCNIGVTQIIFIR